MFVQKDRTKKPGAAGPRRRPRSSSATAPYFRPEGHGTWFIYGERMSSFFKSPPVMVAIIISSLLLMGAIDCCTGQELVFSCAYLVPVSLTAWWFSRNWMIVMSFASGITAFVADEFDGYAYSHPGIQYWNGFTCLVISLVAGLVLSRLKRTLTERKLANERLRSALGRLEASTLEIRKLQSGLQTVCAWTKRIKVGEEWMTPDDFLSTQLHLKLTHGISPNAYRELHHELAGAA